jgi:hypothetical protein
MRMSSRLLMRTARRLLIPGIPVDVVAELVGRADAAQQLKQVFAWERERSSSMIKGVGGLMAGIVLALVGAAFDSNAQPSMTALVAISAFVVLLLLWSGLLLWGLQRLGDEYTMALALLDEVRM